MTPKPSSVSGSKLLAVWYSLSRGRDHPTNGFGNSKTLSPCRKNQCNLATKILSVGIWSNRKGNWFPPSDSPQTLSKNSCVILSLWLPIHFYLLTSRFLDSPWHRMKQVASEFVSFQFPLYRQPAQIAEKHTATNVKAARGHSIWKN